MSSKVVSCIYDLLDLGTSGTWKSDGTVVLNRPPASSKLERIKFRSFSANILPSISNSSIPNINGELRANVYQFDNSSGTFNEYSANNTPMSITINSLNGNKTYTQDEDSILLSTFATSITDDIESSIENALNVGKATLGQFLSTNFIDAYRYRTPPISYDPDITFYDRTQFTKHVPIWTVPDYVSGPTPLKPFTTVDHSETPDTTDTYDRLVLNNGASSINKVLQCKPLSLPINTKIGHTSLGTIVRDKDYTAYGFTCDGSNNQGIDYEIACNQIISQSTSKMDHSIINFNDVYNKITIATNMSPFAPPTPFSSKILLNKPADKSYYSILGSILDSFLVFTPSVFTGDPTTTGSSVNVKLNEYCFLHLFYGPYDTNQISFKQSRTAKEFVTKVAEENAYLRMCFGVCSTVDNPEEKYTLNTNYDNLLPYFAAYFNNNFTEAELNDTYLLDFVIDRMGSNINANHIGIRFLKDNAIGVVNVSYSSWPSGYTDNVITIGTDNYLTCENQLSGTPGTGYGIIIPSDITVNDIFDTEQSSNAKGASDSPWSGFTVATKQFMRLNLYATFTHNALGLYNLHNGICSKITLSYADSSSKITSEFSFNTTANVIPYNIAHEGTLTQNGLDYQFVTDDGQTIKGTLTEDLPITSFFMFYNTDDPTSLKTITTAIPMNNRDFLSNYGSTSVYDYYRTYTTSIIVGSTDSSVNVSSIPSVSEYPTTGHVKFGSLKTLIIDTDTINNCFMLNQDGTYSTFVLLTSDNKYAIEFFVSLYTEPDIFEFSRQYAPFSLYNSNGKTIFKNISWKLSNNALLTFSGEASIKNVAPELVGNIDTYIKLRNTDLTLKLVSNDFPTLNNIVFYLNETAMIDFKEASCSPNESVLECRIVDYRGNILLPTDASLLYSSIVIAIDWQFY